MKTKRIPIVLFASLILIISVIFVSAQNLEIKIDKTIYQQGDKIKYTIQLYDDSNNPIPGNVDVEFKDATGFNTIKRTVPANEEQEINLGNQALFGYWKIIAKFNNKEVTRLFTIESNEQVSFELNGNELIITNTGNIPYSKTIQIAIGDIIETKKIELNIGESTNLKLVAPDGTYNIQVSDGKTTISRQNVQLTGNAVAIVNPNEAGSVPITGVNRPLDDSTKETSAGDIFNKSKLALVFVFAFLVLFILVVVQRFNERKNLKKKKR